MRMHDFVWSKRPPHISVITPMFRALYIGWLCMESLSRQRTATPWELIIAEETKDVETYGLERVLSYENAFKNAGCVKLTYIDLDHWIPLADKQALIMRNTDPVSEIFAFHGADSFYPSTRLDETARAFSKGKTNWFSIIRSYRYHLGTNQLMLVDRSFVERKDDTLGRAIRASVIRKGLHRIKDATRGVDSLIYRSCNEVLNNRLKFTFDNTDMWQGTLVVEGIGTLSTKVKDRLFSGKRPLNPGYEFRGTALHRIIPQDIAKRVIECRKVLKRHDGSRPNWKYNIESTKDVRSLERAYRIKRGLERQARRECQQGIS